MMLLTSAEFLWRYHDSGHLAHGIVQGLAGAGVPNVSVAGDRHPAGNGFLAVPATGTVHLRAAVTWYEDGKPTGGPNAPAGTLRECEQALRRAGFHVEYTTEIMGGCLLAWRRTRT